MGGLEGRPTRDLEGLSQGSMAPFPTKNQDFTRTVGLFGAAGSQTIAL